MTQLIKLFRGCLLTSFAAIHLHTYSSPSLKTTEIMQEDVFHLPNWIVKETVLDQLTWQGLPMKIEFFSIPKLKEDFLIEIASLIPEGAMMSKTSDGDQISWFDKRTSYVLFIEESSFRDTTQSIGVLSSIELRHGVEAKSMNTNYCSMRWLPDNVQLIFSMGHQAGGINQARIEGYSSTLSFGEVRSIVIRRLKKYGWVSLAEYPHRSQLGSSTIFEAFCGNQHARIDLQKQSFQTRISVMSIVQ